MQILQSLLQVSRADGLLFFATTGCAYLSQPSLYEMEASSFSLQLISYMRFRFLKMKNQNASGMERVYVAKKLCCIYGDRGNSSSWMRKLTFNGIPDEELNKFDERWTEFENTNTSKAFENVCDFFHSQNPSDDNCNVL
ncbi:uncharacterized protein LOC119077156 [Bradysia coprophila]|uniref:uncharacterized protein LOC119077156 n=1 Tax=Bradysia coprophila TaxID=38358 RepID=UPI00187DBB45|nr:uncharacterized protein LOC119077156 [Bradysia coprophila]XP_037040240.1 uncharacterized protein LOC119077156 [Bradysia coprophila]